MSISIDLIEMTFVEDLLLLLLLLLNGPVRNDLFVNDCLMSVNSMMKQRRDVFSMEATEAAQCNAAELMLQD